LPDRQDTKIQNGKECRRRNAFDFVNEDDDLVLEKCGKHKERN